MQFELLTSVAVGDHWVLEQAEREVEEFLFGTSLLEACSQSCQARSLAKDRNFSSSEITLTHRIQRPIQQLQSVTFITYKVTQRPLQVTKEEIVLTQEEEEQVHHLMGLIIMANTGGSGGMAGTINGNPTAAGGEGGNFYVQGGDGQQSGPYTLANNKGTDIFYSGAGGGGGGDGYPDGGSVNGYTGSHGGYPFSGGGASFLSNGNAREESGALGSGGYFNGGGGYYMVEFITEVIPN